MKNDNTKEKRMQTLPLLYYINKTLLCKQFSIITCIKLLYAS